jgi:hypothetical protein
VLYDDGDIMDMEPGDVYAGAVLYHVEVRPSLCVDYGLFCCVISIIVPHTIFLLSQSIEYSCKTNYHPPLSVKGTSSPIGPSPNLNRLKLSSLPL